MFLNILIENFSLKCSSNVVKHIIVSIGSCYTYMSYYYIHKSLDNGNGVL